MEQILATLQVRMPAEVIRKLKAEAAKLDLAPGALITRLIEAAYPNGKKSTPK